MIARHRLIVLLAALAISASLKAEVTPVQTHAEAVAEWRAARHERLSSPGGWLTLVGLEWLQEGNNTLGSSPASDIRIPGGPENWGTINLSGDELKFEFAGSEPSVTVELTTDKDGQTPTTLSSGSISFHTIFRESYGIRMLDARAPALLAFEAVENFAVDSSWRIEADFQPAEPDTTMQIGNVLGQLLDMQVLGTISFERDGRVHQLTGLGDESSENVWFIFSDRTAGRETYGAGRFLYSDGLPEDGKLVVDFNKAYNPPCAFNEYSTCPLPPQENRVDLAIMAGEKDFH